MYEVVFSLFADIVDDCCYPIVGPSRQKAVSPHEFATYLLKLGQAALAEGSATSTHGV